MKTVDSKPSSILSPSNWKFWLLIAFIYKFSFLVFAVGEHRPTQIANTIATCTGDCFSYLDPIDNFLEAGTYSPDYRLPGYGFVYMLIRLFFKASTSVSVLIIVQTLLDALACYCIAKTALLIFKEKIAFYYTFLAYTIALTVSCYNNWVLTESLTSSILVFGFYFLTLSHSKDKPAKYLFISGLFFVWSYFLRPVNFPIYILALLFSIYRFRNNIKPVLYFLIPFILINGAWTARNFVVHKKVYLLASSMLYPNYTQSQLKIFEFCQQFGEFRIYLAYFESQPPTYFGQDESSKINSLPTLPNYIYTPDFNEDSLLAVRHLNDRLSNNATPADEKIMLDSLIALKMSSYTASFKKYHFWQATFATPIILFRMYILQSGVHYVYVKSFSTLPMYQKLIKLFYILIYYVTFVAFILSLVIYFFQPKNILLTFVALAVLYFAIIYPVVLRNIEARYFVPAYPYLVIASTIAVIKLKKYFSHKHDKQ